MKAMKKILAVLLTLTLVAALIPAVFADPATTGSIEITNSVTGYTYVAYQIFAGDVSETTSDGKTSRELSNITWGEGLSDNGKNALIALATPSGDNPVVPTTAKAVAENIQSMHIEARDIAAALATVEGGAFAIIHGVAIRYDETAKKYTATVEPGYYFIQNSAVPTDTSTETFYDTAYSDFIVQVLGTVEISPKSDVPSVDKQIKDENVESDREQGSTDGWGETADHELFETFQYKLTATIPDTAEIAAYDEYTLIFKDNCFEGITIEDNFVVSIGDHEITNYTNTFDSDESEHKFEITVKLTNKDGKGDAFNKVTKIGGTTVTVVYDAFLNEKAVIGNHPDNSNTVYLDYSNNPNGTGMGHTAPDTVWAFTYEIDNIKVEPGTGENAANVPLAGAGFTLYSDSGYTTPVKLVSFKGGYRKATQAEIDAAKAAEEAGGTPVVPVFEEITTPDNGEFNYYGLDVGTYYLRETNTPNGYNTCPDMTIVLTANNHKEDATTTTATTNISMTVNNEVKAKNMILNLKGTVLPTTGGIGTTLFYVFGSILVIGAGVLLVSKKRMGAAE